VRMNESTNQSNPPFKTLGTHLKYLREQHRESLLEASGAVEIDAQEMERIEAGLVRPSEDILLLLIQHYNMADQEAGQLWELAGYDGDVNSRQFQLEDLSSLPNKQLVMLLALDVRTMYSDGVDININQAGITLNFTQAAGKDQRVPIAKVGMSYDQAAQVLKTLETALLKAKYLRGPKGLPEPKDPKASE